jgi:mannose-1-phosphate guanylyltransferase
VKKAFLLAAGLGTRIRPLTNDIPKCLLKINNKPLLQIWIELLIKYNIDEVLINTHWYSEKVSAFFNNIQNSKTLDVEEDGKYILSNNNGKQSIKVILYNEKDLLGSAGTIWANKNWLSDENPFFILYADNLTNIDLNKMWRYHKDNKSILTLGVLKTKNPKECGIVENDKDNIVTSFLEKPSNPKSNLAAAGIYIADKEILRYFPRQSSNGDPLDLGYDVLPNLIGKMKTYKINELLIDIGTMESFQKAQTLTI